MLKIRNYTHLLWASTSHRRLPQQVATALSHTSTPEEQRGLNSKYRQGTDVDIVLYKQGTDVDIVLSLEVQCNNQNTQLEGSLKPSVCNYVNWLCHHYGSLNNIQ